MGTTLFKFDGQTITFDTNANPLSYYNGTRWTFTWENGRSLATATDGTTSISYAYDADGLRTAKTVGSVTHKYLYASGQLLRESYGNNILDFFYDANGYPYALKYNGTTYYYITNLQGDVMYLVDAQGNTVATYDYDPYGNIISATGTMAEVNPLRYRGYYYDADLKMYYLQSRYYDPAIGRFLNADVYASTGQGVVGFNMFSYCTNNPVNRLDLSGDCSWFFGKRDCGKTTCKNSKFFIKRRVAVIYDGRSSGSMVNLYQGSGFKIQGRALAQRLSKTCNVESYSYITIDGFVHFWNSLNGKYDAIYIVGHGQPGKFNFKGNKSLKSTGGDRSYSDLQKVTATDLFLYICNGATPDSKGVSTAKCFARLTGGTVHAVAYGKMNISLYGNAPTLKGGVWVRIRA